ncbi:hypothetical protein GCM10009843_07420 [Nocardioides bigeumensis]|uniref:SbsA Ig-like domain-containing protein n=1 Tax=Nocardioides bigeumensis TaxID=433657 RepID=A0ABP5JEI0_9ACTN
MAATTLSLLAPLAPAAQAAALAAPGGLSVANKNSSTPILSWVKVKGASGYQVQVDNDASFASPEFSVSTVNFRVVPTTALRPGANFWRVRATAGSTTSSWSGGNLSVSPVGVPVPSAPGNGAVLQQPDSPPLLRWEGAQGATSYTVQLDGDADFIGAKSYTTKTTSLVAPDPLAVGDYYWRVIASKAAGIASVPSATSSFSIAALPAPGQTYPPNSVDFTLQDVVLDWNPVNGARYYQVEVALDAAFTNVIESRSNILGTRYSRPQSLPNNQYWWRVRGFDALGQATPWTTSVNGFRRNWPDRPVANFPIGSAGSPATMPSDEPYLDWTPVAHASSYEIQMADDENFSTDVRTCTTALTTYTIFPGPHDPDDPHPCHLDNGVNWWRVRPLDNAQSGSTAILGLYSAGQAFTYAAPTVDAAPPDTPFSPVDGTQIAIGGRRLDVPGGCTLDDCGILSTTPVFDWDAQQYAKYYRVLVSEDADFTNIAANTVTTRSRLAFTGALRESSAGGSYYWYVVPCRTGSADLPTGCGPDPRSVDGLPGVKQFRKVSPAVAGLSSSDPAGTEITFHWEDYFTTNQATIWQGESGNQSARQYRLQVATDSTFSNVIDTAVVDQTTYTAYTSLYPEGTLHWRVQALDNGLFGLPWSTGVTSIVKSSPAVVPTSPGNGAAAPGTVPFTWAAQPYAQSYTLEVYRNNDAAFSTVNRVFSATVKTAAYAWNQAVPASDTPYTWRVRRTDADGNIGPWSQTMRFTSLGSVPQLLAPGNSWQPSAGPLFEWTEVAGAASYVLEVRSNTSTSVLSVATTATAHAPVKALGTADYMWRVIAKDTAGQVLGTSANGVFKVDATAPTIVKVKPPRDKLKPKSLVYVKFSEAVKGVTKKSLYITPEGKKKPMKAKVTINKKKTKAIVDVKKRFKPGTYVLHATTKIKDLRGNPLAGGQAVTIGQ